MTLAEQNVSEVGEDTKPLSVEEAKALKAEIPGWSLAKDGDELKRKFEFANFREAMNFVNRVADLAEEFDHHPEIDIEYNAVELEFSTHKIKGLSMNDFIMAAKVNTLLE